MTERVIVSVLSISQFIGREMRVTLDFFLMIQDDTIIQGPERDVQVDAVFANILTFRTASACDVGRGGYGFK